MSQNFEPPTFQMPSPYPAAGEIIDGKYQVERILGEGGMGAVAKATHLLRRAPVALKFMSPAVTSMNGAVERFVNEGVAASQIDSDHVVKVFDVGQLKTGAPYLVMEYLEGCDLAQLLVRDGRPGLPTPRAVHFILQALRGLQVAHAAGIIHRDMKPSNCFIVTKDGEPDFVKLVDFGISKVQQPGGGHITRTNSALGTPLYMSPEQARSPRDVDLRSDLYSVSVILYECLTGRTPFHSESGEFTEILFKIFTMDPPSIKTLRPDLPDGLCAAIHVALQRDPARRYGSATEMAEALGAWADERSHHILSRMRTRASHYPSAFPPADPMRASAVPQSIVPAAPARHQSAHARTQDRGNTAQSAGMRPGPDTAQSPQSPAAHTDMAASRDAARPAAPKRTGLVVAILAVLAVGAAAGGYVIVKGMAPTATSSANATAAPPPSTEALPPTQSAPPQVTVSIPPTAPSVVTPPPSATAPVSATAVTSTVVRPPTTAKTAPTVKTTTPGELGTVRIQD